ncbi:MAG: hypothetical protein CMK09_07635 [Ponticaulis sp.]|nr:hypothetical protein [Ponticaulis sp.]
MFGRLFGGKPAPAYDPCEGHRLCDDGLTALQSEDWARLSDLYSQQRASDRFHWIQGIGQSLSLDFEDKSPPDDPVIHCILGGVWTFLAFRYRGAGVASTVKQTSAERMSNALEISEWYLDRARSTELESSVPVSLMLRNALGSHTNRDILSSLIQQNLESADPCIFGAHNYLTCQTAKWLGSRDEMWAAAELCLQAAPNSAWQALKARAIIEDWLWFENFEDDMASKQRFLKDFASETYRERVEALDDAFWVGLSPDVPRSERHYAHNNFAWLLHQLNLKDRAIRHIEEIGAYPTTTPWGYSQTSENLVRNLNRIRTSLGLARLEA